MTPRVVNDRRIRKRAGDAGSDEYDSLSLNRGSYKTKEPPFRVLRLLSAISTFQLGPFLGFR